jgi:phage regulator Rha-like protein
MQVQVIQNKIYNIREQKVMFDFDLAELYNVETRVLNQAVKRNESRFPKDFMFQLSKKEWDDLKSQFVTSTRGGTRSLPHVFTEHGVTMLASVLKSSRAIKMNIAIVRAFVGLKKFAIESKELADQMYLLRQRIGEHDAQLNQIYNAIENILEEKKETRTWETRERIGFKK